MTEKASIRLRGQFVFLVRGTAEAGVQATGKSIRVIHVNKRGFQAPALNVVLQVDTPVARILALVVRGLEAYPGPIYAKFAALAGNYRQKFRVFRQGLVK